MAERKHNVFIVATSNDITGLPPELVRKGRLDEIFFVDLPEQKVREEIYRIHLKKRNLDPGQFDLLALALCCEGFSGAEIEQSVVSAIHSSSAKSVTVNTAGIIQEIYNTSPLSRVMDDKINALREWADGRTVNAD
jgi:SpoVK/Ycf46/Vps4 family AAA+-type ATPase